MKAAGDVHDPENPRVKDLMNAAAGWAAENKLGTVLQVRYDVDERGGAVCDLFTVPTYTHAKTGRRFIGVNRAHQEVARRAKKSGRNSFRLLQDSWHAYLAEHVDEAIERGQPKAETAREHVSPEDWGAAVEAEVTAERERLEAVSKSLALRQAAVVKREAGLQVEGAKVDRKRRALETATRDAVQQAEAVLRTAGKRQ